MAQASRLLVNGRIWCGLNDGFVSAIALDDDGIMARGTDSDMMALAGSGTEVIDLRGRLATPGLHDAHLHLHAWGLSLLQKDFRRGAQPGQIADVLADLREIAAATPPGDWVIARGLDEASLAERRLPSRGEIDAAVPNHPVYLLRTCNHVAVVNSAALARAGLRDDTPDPAGGSFGRADGRLTGILRESARVPVQAVLPGATLEDLVAAIERAGHELLRYGITSVMEAAIGRDAASGQSQLEAYLAARDQGRMPVRVTGTLLGDIQRNILTEAWEAGHITGAGDDMFRIGPVKLFTDGSAGAATAWMTEAYPDDPDNFGMACLTQEQTDALVLRAHSLGYQIAPHAIGDAAIDMVLNAYEKAFAAQPAPDRRHRIEHCGWVRPDQIARMQAMGIIPAGQATFLHYFGDGYIRRLGHERASRGYPFRSWRDAGLEPSASSDCPATSPAPMPCLHAMVTRQTRSGAVMDAGQCLSVAQALHLYTYGSAYGVGQETRRGRLVAGQLADIAVFDTDLFTCPPEQILTTRCLMTLRGGDVVFRAVEFAQ